MWTLGGCGLFVHLLYTNMMLWVILIRRLSCVSILARVQNKQVSLMYFALTGSGCTCMIMFGWKWVSKASPSQGESSRSLTQTVKNELRKIFSQWSLITNSGLCQSNRRRGFRDGGPRCWWSRLCIFLWWRGFRGGVCHTIPSIRSGERAYHHPEKRGHESLKMVLWNGHRHHNEVKVDCQAHRYIVFNMRRERLWRDTFEQ